MSITKLTIVSQSRTYIQQDLIFCIPMQTIVECNVVNVVPSMDELILDSVGGFEQRTISAGEEQRGALGGTHIS